jgi:hypothetical protein
MARLDLFVTITPGWVLQGDTVPEKQDSFLIRVNIQKKAVWFLPFSFWAETKPPIWCRGLKKDTANVLSKGHAGVCFIKCYRYPIGDGLHKCVFSMATRPHPSQEYFMAESLSLHMWVASALGVPQKLHLAASPQGLHRCPGASATAPQFLHE